MRRPRCSATLRPVRSTIPVAALWAALAGGCASEAAPEGAGPGPAATPPLTREPTWNGGVGAVLAEHCGACHGSVAPVPPRLDSASAAAEAAKAIVASTADGSMPPWGLGNVDGCEPRGLGAAHLDAAERELLSAWASAGAPVGTGAEPRLDWSGGLPSDAVLKPKTAWTTAFPDGAEQEACVLLPAPRAGGIEALQFVPSDAAAVSFAEVAVVGAAEAEGLPVRAEPGEPFLCTGLPWDPPRGGKAEWAPGHPPFVLPPDAAMALQADDRIAVLVAYDPAAEPAEQSFELRLKLAPAPGAQAADVVELGFVEGYGEGLQPGPGDRDGPEFRIPAGARGHLETLHLPVPEEFVRARLWAAALHMGPLGVSGSIRLLRDGRPSCLLPVADFDPARAPLHPMATLPLQAGDVFEVRCVFDNAGERPAESRRLEQLGRETPSDVAAGEIPAGEECVAELGLLMAR